ncbi:MAG TPA: hypothetical protein VFA04_27770 [Bryobacteraceae bacterium]|nr:hypothetical protein [Bryobacteraceae bacterium]
MNNNPEQRRGLGGALYAVYGAAPDWRETRVFRSPVPFLVAALRNARLLLTQPRARKPSSRGPVS